MRRRALFMVAAASIALAGCAKEVGRVRLSGAGSAEAPVALKAGEVSFWSDIDIAYEGDAALAYQVELVQNGAPVATATCDPLGVMHVKMSWVETNAGSRHSRRGLGKMTCSATLASAGPTTVRTKLAFSREPASVTLKKADLVVKQ